MNEELQTIKNWIQDHQAIAIGAGAVIILIVISALIR